MKGANKYERFSIAVMDRSEIHGADYNPRKISDSARAKLKRHLKSEEGGLLAPLVWNSKTGNLVSGHQRLSILDDLHRGKPYKLTLAVTEMEEKDEVRANVFMNNPSAQGDWDVELLHGLRDIVPDLDFVNDLGFEEEELDIMGLDFASDDILNEEDNDSVQDDNQATSEEYRDIKKKAREKAKKENEDGDGTSYSQSDFTLTFIFSDADSKREFMRSIKQPEKACRLNSEVLFRIINQARL